MPALKQALRASWTATLQLPRSSFPARPLLADRPEYLRRCCDSLYRWQSENQAPKKEPFVLHDGPPYANGSLHVGHALNKILKDVTCRTRLLQGQRISYTPGWDCHGLPIELKALQQRGVQSSSDAPPLAPGEVREVARSLALDTVEEQKAAFREWAIMGDWQNAWKTMDKEFELSQLRIFKTMLESGLIYQKNKPVYWSPSSRTALAEAELEYNEEHRSTAVFVKFPLLNPPGPLRSTSLGIDVEVSAAIWTTTPWTLVANRALAVHNSLEYSLVNSAQLGPILVASSRLAELGKVVNENLVENVVASVMGNELVGSLYYNPLVATNSAPQPILHGDFVSSESGTGIVHSAPGHGMDDYKLLQAHNIEPYAPVDDLGRFTAEAFPSKPELLHGKPVLQEGTQAVLRELESKGMLLHTHDYQHSYPYDWRSKQPVIIRATRQWFANLEGIRGSALHSLENVKFVPAAGKTRLSSFVRNRTEWCISRQRPWGVPIPALYDLETGAALMTPESVEHIMGIIKDRGSDAWWNDELDNPAWIPASARGAGRFYRGRDTMDVWFDSGTSWTQMVSKHSGQSGMADVYLEGSDQHRGWFQSSLLTRIASQSKTQRQSNPIAPFKSLITHGFTLDEHGRKMSKSIGNVIDPEQIMQGTLLPPIKRKAGKGQPGKTVHDGLGPDALRLWAANSDYTRDIIISIPVLQGVHNNLTKLRVTLKLLLGFLDTYTPSIAYNFDDLELNNQLVLFHLQRLTSTVTEAFQKFEYYKAVAAINSFVATDLSASYVESIKDRMYADAPQSPSRMQAQAVIWQIFQKLAHSLWPITPLLAEEALAYLPKQLFYHPISSTWQAEGAKEQLIVGEWHSPALEALAPALAELNVVVKALQEEIRSTKKMGSSLQSEVVLHVSSAPKLSAVLERYSYAIEDMLVVSRLRSSTEPVPQSWPGTTWSITRSAVVAGEPLDVVLHSPLQGKCARCWKYTVPEDQGLELCHRCVDVLEGIGMVSDGPSKI